MFQYLKSFLDFPCFSAAAADQTTSRDKLPIIIPTDDAANSSPATNNRVRGDSDASNGSQW
jgi:hypothetical protein